MNELEIEIAMLTKQLRFRDALIDALRVELAGVKRLLVINHLNIPCIPFSLTHPDVIPFGFSVSKHPPVSHPCQLQKLGSSAPVSKPVSNDLDRDKPRPWVCAKCYAVMLNNEANCVRCGGEYYFSNNPEGRRNIYP